MKRSLATATLVTFILATGIIYGIALHKYQVFPYGIIKTTYNRFVSPQDNEEKTYGPWSIGIYDGSTPFDLTSGKDISNPVLTGKDVADVDAEFVADPFMVFDNDRYTLFFEVLNRETDQGDIAYAESIDRKTWEYKKILIDEPFHLSYPYVFEWNNDYYLVPESHQDLSVRLYKAISFPDKWEYVGNLLEGWHYVDPSIFRYKDKWWLFVTTPQNDVLYLYYSNELMQGWKPHPMNPIVKLDANFARPGGRVIVDDGRVYRFAQDDEPSYGIQVFAFEVTELSETSYSEKLLSTKPIVKNSGAGWNAAGMHHVDLFRTDSGWIAAVDGKDE